MYATKSTKPWDPLDELTAETAVARARAERARYREIVDACEIIESVGLWPVLSTYLRGWWYCADFGQEAKDMRRF